MVNDGYSNDAFPGSAQHDTEHGTGEGSSTSTGVTRLCSNTQREMANETPLRL